MANLFVNLPMPVGNGAGAAVDTSGMGRDKSIVVDGTFVGALITIEVSVDGGTSYAPIATFQSGINRMVVPAAAIFMRARVAGRAAGVPFSATVSVGANDNGGQFDAIPMPAGNGSGVALNAAAHGSFSTFIVSGVFPGATVKIETSEDGATWATLVVFAGQGGILSKDEIADNYRVTVSGRTAGAPFTATAAVGSINDPITSGSAGAATPYVFVLRPGDAPHDNVYDDFALLTAASSAVEGTKIIEFDDTLDVIVIPAGTYDVDDCQLIGKATQPSVVTIGAGVSFTGLRWIGKNLRIDYDSTTPLCDDIASGDVLYFDHCEVNVGVNIGALYQAGLTVTDFQTQWFFATANTTTTDAVIESLGAGVDIGVKMDGESIISSACFRTLDATSSLTVEYLTPEQWFANQTGWAGTIDYITALRSTVTGVQDVQTAEFTASVGFFWRALNIGEVDMDCNLDPSIDVAPGDQVTIKNLVASGANLVVTPDGTDTLNGAAVTIPLAGGESIQLIYVGGGNWESVAFG